MASSIGQRDMPDDGPPQPSLRCRRKARATFRYVAGLSGWQQVALGLCAVSVSGVVALVGQWISRRSAAEVTDRADRARVAADRQWRASLDALQDRWQRDRDDSERRRAEDDERLTRRWSRERTLDLLDKAITRALDNHARVQAVGRAQLAALGRSNLLQPEEQDLLDKVLLAIVSGLESSSDAVELAEDEDVEVVVVDDEHDPESGDDQTHEEQGEPG